MDKQLTVKPDNQFNQLSLQQKIQFNMDILREMITNGQQLTEMQIRGRAAFAAQQGLDAISEVYTMVDSSGKTMGHTMAINGLRRKNQEQLLPGQSVQLEFVPLPKEEMDPKWMYAFECRLRDDQSHAQWIKRLVETGKQLRDILGELSIKDLISMVGPEPVYTGIGIFYKSEVSDWKDQKFNPIERAKKRAEVAARHHRFSTCDPEYDVVEGAPGEMQTVEISTLPVVKPEPKKVSYSDTMAGLGFIGEPEPEVNEPEFIQDGDFRGLEGEGDATPQIPEEVERAMSIKAKCGRTFGEHSVDELLLMEEKANAMTPDMRSRNSAYIAAIGTVIGWKTREVVS